MKTVFIALALMAAGCGGSQGATGAAGATGPADKIVGGTHCQVSDSGSGTPLQYIYDSTTTISGDRRVSCAVSTASQESSYTVSYASTQPGATSGSCSVNLGVGATDFGFWTFTSSGTTKVVYTDAGSPHNGYSFTIPSGSCSTF